MAQPAVFRRVWSNRLLSISARVLAAVFVGLLLVGPGLHAQQAVSEKEALGVLQRCLQCHGPALQMSKLDLSTREGMLKGGDHGVAIVPGNAEESLIYKRITGQVKPAMPRCWCMGIIGKERSRTQTASGGLSRSLSRRRRLGSTTRVGIRIPSMHSSEQNRKKKD